MPGFLEGTLAFRCQPRTNTTPKNSCKTTKTTTRSATASSDSGGLRVFRNAASGPPKGCGPAPAASTYRSFVQVGLQWFAGCENGPDYPGIRRRIKIGNEQCEVLRSRRGARSCRYCKACFAHCTCYWSRSGSLGSSRFDPSGRLPRGSLGYVARTQSHPGRGGRADPRGGFR
jgi:hypothetical protein